jgi:hypothetical protein
MHQTCNLQSEIVAVVKEKREQYKVWFRSGSETRLATLKILHVCSMRCVKPNEQSDCKFFSSQKEACSISNIIYSKQSAPQELKAAAITA